MINEQEATIKKYFIVQNEGERKVSREMVHYNLQMIIAVGFKVNNDRAVRFHKWSGQIVKDYTIQGWSMDKERLKKGICSQMNTLNVNCKIFVRFAFLSVNSIKKSQICMFASQNKEEVSEEIQELEPAKVPENETQIFASKYKLYLPSEEELLQELQREYRALEYDKEKR